MAARKAPTSSAKARTTKRRDDAKPAEGPPKPSSPTDTASPLSVAITGGPTPKKGRKKWRDSLPSRAREQWRDSAEAPAPPPRESSTEERVIFVAGEMASGRWDGYVSRVPLAMAWGVTDDRIRQLATEAHRLLAYDPAERDQKRASLAAFCAQQRERASRERNMVTGLPDFGAALKAAELEAKFIGIELATKATVEVTGKDGGPVTFAQGPTIMIPPEREPEPEPEPDGQHAVGDPAPAAP